MISNNIYWQHMGITRDMREKQFGCRSFLIWLTGLSGSGKSAIAREFQLRLFAEGYPVYLLDGDNIRHGLNSDLGFDAQARKENIRRVGEVAKLFVDAGVITVASFISPYEADRQFVRNLFIEGEFIEVHVKASVEACENRDVKGLYKKARQGLIKDFTGVSAPYEVPANPEVVLNTEEDNLASCVNQLHQFCFKQSKVEESINRIVDNVQAEMHEDSK